MSRDVLSTTPGKIIDDKNRAEFDRRETVICFLSHKISPVCLEAQVNKFVYIFDRTEIEPIRNEMIANRPMPVDFNDVILALENWANANALFRDWQRSR